MFERDRLGLCDGVDVPVGLEEKLAVVVVVADPLVLLDVESVPENVVDWDTVSV